jgi:hypothetical protein
VHQRDNCGFLCWLAASAKGFCGKNRRRLVRVWRALGGSAGHGESGASRHCTGTKSAAVSRQRWRNIIAGRLRLPRLIIAASGAISWRLRVGFPSLALSREGVPKARGAAAPAWRVL